MNPLLGSSGMGSYQDNDENGQDQYGQEEYYDEE